MTVWIIFIFGAIYFGATACAEHRKIVPARFERLYYQSRISGGEKASPEQFPWQVFISATGSGEVSQCGGSLLNRIWALTAAHCTYNFLSLDLYFGSTDIFSMPEILTSTYWIEHSNYDPSNYNNDISVIQLPTDITYTPSIQPIALQSFTQANANLAGQVVIVLGFGDTSDTSSQSYDLLYTNVRIITNSDCAYYYGSNIVTPKSLCAMGATSPIQSICNGDSGGPMVMSDGNGGYIQVGINSFVSQSGCTSGLPSGYVRLGKFLSWIRTHTGITIAT